MFHISELIDFSQRTIKNMKWSRYDEVHKQDDCREQSLNESGTEKAGHDVPEKNWE